MDNLSNSRAVLRYIAQRARRVDLMTLDDLRSYTHYSRLHLRIVLMETGNESLADRIERTESRVGQQDSHRSVF